MNSLRKGGPGAGAPLGHWGMRIYEGAAVLIVEGEPVSVEAELLIHGRTWSGALHVLDPSARVQAGILEADRMELRLPSGARGTVFVTSSTPARGVEIQGSGRPPF